MLNRFQFYYHGVTLNRFFALLTTVFIVIFSHFENAMAQAKGQDFSFDRDFNEGKLALKSDVVKAAQCLKRIEKNSDKLSALEKAKANYYLRLKLIYSNSDSLKALDYKMFAAPDTLPYTDSVIFSARRFLQKSMPDKAIPMLMQAIDSLPKGSDKADFCIINLCEAYRQKQEYRKGIEMLNELLFGKKAISDENRAFAFNRIAALYHEGGNKMIHNTDSVINYSMKCISLSEEINSIPNLGAAQNELGFQYFLQKRYDESLTLLNKAIENFTNAGLRFSAMNVFINVSNIYMGLGRPAEAANALDSATRLCNIEENRNLFMRIYWQYAWINETAGNYKDAYDFMNITLQLQNDFFKDRIDMQINEQSARYDLLVKEQKISEEKQKNEYIHKQFIFLVAIMIVLVIAFVITFFYLKLRRKEFLNQKLLEAVIETETNERQRIASDLHDGLGPVISAINHYFQAYIDAPVIEKDTIQARLQQVISGAIDDVSRISHNISPYVLEKYGLITALNHFISPLTNSNKINILFTANVNQRFELKKELTIYRCITELINNTLKHAGADRIAIEISCPDHVLMVFYSDNGKGFDPNAQQQGGMGLFNIRNRVETLGGKLSLNSSPEQGIHVNIELPV